MYVVRKRLYADEGAPARTRVNPDTGEVETTPDDGITWVPDERSDPRLNPAYQLPPNTAPDPACAAAAGMVENVRRVVNSAAGGSTVAGIATAMIGLLLIPGVGWMFYAFLLFAGSIVAAGGAAVLAAFTEDVYDFLLCQFLEQLDPDGRITTEGLEAVQAAAAGEFGDPLVGTVLEQIFYLHKFVGFNNAGVTYADPDAECVCNNWCYVADFTTTDGGLTILLGAGTWTSGLGWEATDVVIGVPRTLLEGVFDFGGDVFINTIDMHYNYIKVTADPGTEGTGVWANEFSAPLFSYNQDVAPEGIDLSINISSGIPQPLQGVSMFIQPAYNTNGGEAVMTIMQIAGSGDPPAWFEDNGWVAC